MPSIDERIVSMTFENAKFEAAVKTTMDTLSKLETALGKVGSTSGFAKIDAEADKVTLSGPAKAIDTLRAKFNFPEVGAAFSRVESAADKVTFGGLGTAIDKIKGKLAFPEAGKAFAKIDTEADKVTLGGISAAIERVQGNFSVLQGAAAVALGNIASKATLQGGAFAKDFAVTPVTQGFDEYGLKLGSIQTIMAATGEGVKPVTDQLSELNTYSDKTIYSFKDMIENIPKFTNAGVDLETSVKAVQGIAQVAALSGASTEEAARSMYNFGQALGTGYVKLIDWKSIELANMGTTEFKQQLIDTAVAMGTLTKQSDGTYKTAKGNEVTTKNFTDAMKDEWLTAESLTTTLEKYTDEQTALGKKAYASATDIKTLSQLMDVLKETIGSGWAASFEEIFGNLEEAKELWGNVNDAVGGFINKTAEARNKILKDWKQLGGRADLIEGIKNIFEGLGTVIKPIKQAFRDIFPRKTGKDLADLTEKFRKFSETFRIDPGTADALRRTFRGVFAVFHILGSVIGNVIELFGDLFGAASGGGDSFLNFTGGIGDFLVAIDNALTKGGALEAFFGALEGIIKIPLGLIKDFGSALGDMFSGGGEERAGETQTALDNLGRSVKPLKDLLNKLGDSWDFVAEKMKVVGDFLGPIIADVLDEIKDIGGIVADEFKKINWDTALEALETGLIAGIFMKIKDLFTGDLSIDLGGGVIGDLGKTLSILNDNLKAIQRNIQANTLLQIATAIILLATGIAIIAGIDGEKLKSSMTAIAVGLGELMAAMALLGIAARGTPIVGMPVIAASLVMLAGAVVVLAGAMKIMSTMDWEEIAKGLVGMGGALVVLGIGTRAMNPAMTLAAAVTLIPLAIGVAILASAVKIFASMSWEDLLKGILGLAGALAAIGLALTLMPATVTIIGPGLLLTAIALTLIGGAVSTFGRMDLVEMGQGILGIAGALAAIGLAMQLMPPTMLVTAAGLVVVGIALTGIGAAVALFGNLDVMTLVKGIAAIGATLVVLAIGLTAMSGTVLGSVALLGAAAAFAVLAPAMFALGNMKWSVIFKGLAAMALTLGVLAAIGLFASGPLTTLGIAIAILGGGLLVTALAFFVFSAALAKLGVQGPKGVSALIAAISAFILILPKLVIDFVKGMVSIASAVADLAPKIVQALATVLTILFAFLITQAPQFAKAAGSLIDAFLQIILEAAPKLIDVGLKLVVALIQGLANNVGKMVDAAANLIVNFLAGLTRAIPRIVRAATRMASTFIHALSDGLVDLVDVAFDAVIDFLNGVAQAIRDNDTELIDAGANILDAIIEGVVEAAGRLAGPLRDAIEHLFGLLPEWARDALGIHSPSTVFAEIGENVIEGFAGGLDSKKPSDAMAKTAKSAMDAAKNGFGKIPDPMAGIVKTDPVITPVLDLTNVHRDAKQLDGLGGTTPIKAELSSDQAADISRERAVQAAQLAQLDGLIQAKQATMQFTQNNYSPESLSSVEIYRRTHNQLSLARDRVSLPAN